MRTSTATLPVDSRILIGPRDAAALLSISERTLYTHTKSGKVPYVELGHLKRYCPAMLRAWVEIACSSDKCHNPTDGKSEETQRPAPSGA